MKLGPVKNAVAAVSVVDVAAAAVVVAAAADGAAIAVRGATGTEPVVFRAGRDDNIASGFSILTAGLGAACQQREKFVAEECIEVEGTITSVLPGTMFRVALDANNHEVLAHISGKMRKHWVRLTTGDRVRLEMSPYDLSKARITYRLS